ncbi:MAG: hypothetical protein CMP84_02935 [Gammaproteobacteria bacterium]|nr:hypothetical protein [Gammaproteobacteria bacterium]
MEMTTDEILKEASLAEEEGDLQKANALFQSAILNQPTNSEINFRYGLFHLACNDVERAIECLQVAVASKPNEIAFRVTYIKALIEGHQNIEAAQEVTKAIKSGLKEHHAHILRLIITSSSGQTSPSEEITEALLRYLRSGKIQRAGELAVNIVKYFPRTSVGWEVLGAVHQHNGNLDKALGAFKTVARLTPESAQAHNNLGFIFKKKGDLHKAEEYYNKAVELEPNYAEAIYNLGNTLQENGKYDQARSSFKKVLALDESFAQARFNLAMSYFESGEYKAALHHFEIVNNSESMEYAARCALMIGDLKELKRRLASLVNHEIPNSNIGSLITRAEVRYGLQIVNPFCAKPLEFVRKTNLHTKYEFIREFFDPIKEFLDGKSYSDKAQRLLYNGSQTAGNIFSDADAGIKNIEECIRSEINDYRSKFDESSEGLISRWPKNYEIYGWLIRMRDGGFLKPHIHERGWLSGSIYIRVPSNLKSDEGNLILRLDDKNCIDSKGTTIERKINVASADLCLFPSSLFHYTTPFSSREERIVLAFDLIPKH